MQAELHGRVQIGPYVEDMPAAYMLADVVVATGGTRQGFSRALVEAQAMGRPVVAEDGGGAAEAVRARRHRLAGTARRCRRRWPRRSQRALALRPSAAPNSPAPRRSMCAAAMRWHKATRALLHSTNGCRQES